MAVGDYVNIILNQEGTAFISEIEDRKNYIIRRASNLSKQSHILAANLDQCMLIVTVNYPETSTTFIDRFLASAEAYRVPVKIIFNKVDAYDEEELHYLDSLINLYTTIGYPCFKVSARKGEGIDTIEKELKGRITLFSGHSGVGKSTRIKAATARLKGLKIGIMGCIVNGPGEMADADYGYVGAARGKVSLYKKKECIEKNIPAEDAVERLLELIRENGDDPTVK